MPRMTLQRILPVALLLAGACRPGVPASGEDAAEKQATLATDTAQARLWREAAASSALPMQVVRLDSGAVRPATPQTLPDRPLPQQPEQPYDPSVDAALTLVDPPVVETAFAGAVRVTAASGEYFTLDLGSGRLLRLHAKVGGTAVRAQTGDQAQLYFTHHGDPFVAGDRIALRLPQDELAYALVGDTSLVSVTLPLFRMTARQVEPVENNTAAVRVTVGGETRVLRHGETAAFDTGNLTVRVLASIAVRGEAANALPGEPYRIHLLSWRARPQR